MADLVVGLDHPAARLVRVAGGKGASLARMASAGLPVPRGFVVTAGCFALAVPEPPDALGSGLDPAGTEGLEALERACSAARRAVLEGGVPPAVASAVGAAYEGMGRGAAVAVRSSATVEDRRWASFAGQYDTFLNVAGLEPLLGRLLAVWASLYSTRAVAYMARLGMRPADVRMAVVVQEQLDPDAAGVLLTRDPLTGGDGLFLINAALGLGEGVASGTAPADSFAVDATTLEVTTRAVGRKGFLVAPAPGGGVRRVEVPTARQMEPAMGPGQLAALGGLAQRVTGLFGRHQDIEFAARGDAIWLLQARPLAGSGEPPPFPVAWEDPADEGYAWVREPLGGPGPAFTLQEDAVGLYARGLAACSRETGSPMARNCIVKLFNGYAYSRSPSVDRAELAQRRERFRALCNAYREQGSSLYEGEIRPQVEAFLARMARFRPRRASVPELVEHLEDALEGYGHIMGDLHWRMTADTRSDWPSTFREITGEPEVASGSLLQGVPNKTTLLVRRLRGLARMAQGDADLGAVLREGAFHRLREEPLARRPSVRRFRARFRGLLRTFGSRTGSGFGSATGFTTPTWNLDPGQPLGLIASYARQDLGALEAQEARARRGRRRAGRRIRRRLAGDPAALARFNREAALALEEVVRMEDHNHIMEQGTAGALREAVHWAGAGLVRAGLLDHPDDVLHLSLAQLRETARGNAPADLRGVVRQRAEEHSYRSLLRPPPRLGSGGAPGTGPMTMYDLPAHVGLEGLRIRGVGASPGRATGRARVVHGATSEPPRVERGDILVARNAGPAWTPILPLVAGLVLDEGAVFQHAALVAREYGIPAVVMARDATATVVDRQTITVDADNGVVELAP